MAIMPVKSLLIFFSLFLRYFCAVKEACPCDLMLGGCDTNCCCDKDCHPDDITKTFICSDNSKLRTLDDRLCVKKTIVYNLANANYTFNETDTGLFCIYFDNYEKRNYYEDVTPINTEETLKHYISNYSSFSYQPASYKPLNITTFYKYGDPVFIVYPGVLALLRLPQTINSQSCSQLAPVAYLDSRTSTCTELITDLKTSCVNSSSLNYAVFLKDFRVLKKPEVLQGLNLDWRTGKVNTNQVKSLDGLYSDSALTIPIVAGSHTCVRSNGYEETCSQLEVGYANDTCANVVTKVTYKIEHEGTAGITGVTVQFTFADIKSSDLPLARTFSTQFVRKSSNTPVQTSGNPGYVVGKPIIIGKADNDKKINFKMGNPQDGLILIKPSTNQKCELSPRNSFTVKFGEDVRTGCLISVTKEDLVKNCDSLHHTLDNLFGMSKLKDIHIAMYGNASPLLTEWVPLLILKKPESSRTCSQFTLGVHFRFLYAKTGSLANPQPKIIGASLVYEQQKLQFKCTDPFCSSRTDNIQHFEVTQTVTFVDVSKPATAVTGEPPIFHAKLPSDFFYPFLMSRSLILHPHTFLITALAVSITFTLQHLWTGVISQ